MQDVFLDTFGGILWLTIFVLIARKVKKSPTKKETAQ